MTTAGFVLVLFACALEQVYSQSTATPTPYEHLPPPLPYLDGEFISPNTTFTQIYSEGTQFNITWNSTYPAVNLYLITAELFGSPITVVGKLFDEKVNEFRLN